MVYCQHTDLTITTEQLVELFATMDDNDYVVLDLQRWLDLPRAKVAEMKRNYHSLSQSRDAYLDLYVTTHPCPSWRQVAEVLRHVGLDHQADVVESTYVQGTMIILMHSLFCCQFYFEGAYILQNFVLASLSVNPLPNSHIYNASSTVFLIKNWHEYCLSFAEFLEVNIQHSICTCILFP